MERSIETVFDTPNQGVFPSNPEGANQSWILPRLTGPGALYNAGNLLALGAGIALNLPDVAGQSGFSQALYAYLMGSQEAVMVTISMVLFLVAGEFYHRAFLPNAQAHLVAWGDFVSGLAGIALTVALVMLGDTAAALLAGSLLTFGKLGSAVLPIFQAQNEEQLDRVLRLTVVASRAPSILSLGIVVVPAFLGSVPLASVLLPLLMIVCFLLWLWADLLLLVKS